MTRSSAILACLALAAGCEPCELSFAKSNGSDKRVVSPRVEVRFTACIDGQNLTCGGHWLVNGIEGGSDIFGRIDSCGSYVAPATFADGLATLEFTAVFPGASSRCDSATIQLDPVALDPM
jgi:hypothetical protein